MNRVPLKNRIFLLGVLAICFSVLSPFAYASNKDLLVSCESTNSVKRYDGLTGAYQGDFVTPGSGGLSVPAGIAIGPDRNLYVASTGNASILRYNGATGAFIDAFVPSGSGGMNQPNDIAFGPDGNLFVANAFPGQVFLFNGTTGAFLNSVASPRTAFTLLFTPDTKILVGEVGFGDFISRFDYNPTTSAFTPLGIFIPTQSGGLDNPVDMSFGPDGQLYISSNSLGGGAPGAILKYDRGTGAFISQFVPVGGGGLSRPWGHVFGPDGNLYLADEGSNTIRRYNGTSGAFINEFVPAGTGGLTAVRYVLFHDITPGDEVPPTISNVSVNPAVLWPPNHKMVDVVVSATVTDNQDPSPTIKIVGIVSNEPDDGTGDGNVSPDVRITGDLTAQLRAERSGQGIGRIYTITLEAKDATGNTSLTTITVSVPKSQGK